MHFVLDIGAELHQLLQDFLCSRFRGSEHRESNSVSEDHCDRRIINIVEICTYSPTTIASAGMWNALDRDAAKEADSASLPAERH